MRRRDFLIGGAGAVTGLVVAGTGDLLLETIIPRARRSEVLRLETWLATLDGVSEVGLRRLERLGDEAPDREAAVEALRQRLRLGDEVALPVRELETRVGEAVREDYAEGRICDVDGWQLSATECDVATAHVLVEDRLAGAVDPGPVEGEIVAVEAWGPRSTQVSQPFNVQSDGHSGLWFRAPGAPSWLKVVVDGDPMPTFVNGDIVTSGLHGETMARVLARPGRYPIEFLDEMAGVRQVVGDFVVRAEPAPAPLTDGTRSTVFCQVENWGPRETRPGVVVNRQPDGSIGIWVLTGCAPEGAVMRAGPRELETHVGTGRVTAKLPVELIRDEGELEISLHDEASGETLAVGRFLVRS